MSEWISVKKRLPKVSFGHSWNGLATDGRVTFRAELSITHYNGITKEKQLDWRGLEECVHGTICPFDLVTHWMELPQPPEKQS